MLIVFASGPPNANETGPHDAGFSPIRLGHKPLLGESDGRNFSASNKALRAAPRPQITPHPDFTLFPVGDDERLDGYLPLVQTPSTSI